MNPITIDRFNVFADDALNALVPEKLVVHQLPDGGLALLQWRFEGEGSQCAACGYDPSGDRALFIPLGEPLARLIEALQKAGGGD